MGREDRVSTKIKCTNTEVVKAFCELFCVYYREGATEAEHSNRSHPTFLEVQELSERYPEDTIFAQFELSEELDEVYIEYKGRIEHLIDYRPNYIIEGSKINDEKIEQKIKDKITEFFKKLEKPEVVDLDYYVHPCIVRSNDDVTYRFELESHGPLERYRVEARKNENHINMKVFKGNAVFEWIELEESNDSEDIVLPC